MLDIKFIRDNTELVKATVTNKNVKADIDKILELDASKRKKQFEFDNLRAEQNRVSKEIAAFKKQKRDVSGIIKKMGELSKEIKTISSELSDINTKAENLLLAVPNIPHESVPVGKDEESNLFIREWGEKKKFDFEPKEHLELAEINGLLDFKRATKLSGSMFAGYTGKGAQLERALINFMLNHQTQQNGYEEISLPFIVNRAAMTGTGQLPKMENDMYRIDEDDLFLIPTAEVPVTNYFAGEILSNDVLPQKFVAYSPCFRREAGSYGKDTRGLQRLHQFNKVEMVQFVKPEESYDVLEEMVKNAESVLQALGMHYRVVCLATGDLSFASAKTYDIEVWAPGAQKYLEVSSISNFVDFQSRRASIRYRDESGKVRFVHTLNGSGLATPRTYISLLENYQTTDGKIILPTKLQPYFNDKNTL
jgi:seryl-tRNA synthetase